ncbi:MAG TPA: molybdate ABC transporter substrate-binding protein [Myxococcota bacterium]|nr:molybdate ABC transporter substrate-binding protein [Myxococcota bacterium]
MSVSSRRPRRPGLFGATLAVVLVVVLPPSSRAETERPLRVLAAASLTDFVRALPARFEGAPLRPSFAGSSTLARQIREGAPADVFLSASGDWIDFLAEANALVGDPIVFARNRLVCITPRGRALATRGVSGPRQLLDRLEPGSRVAIADRGVPAGEYARQALAHRDLLAGLRPRLVGMRDVRAVLRAVEQAELAAGFVYATDAKIASVSVLFAFDPSTHAPIAYQAAVLKQSDSPDRARRFVELLQSPIARDRLLDAGFALP